MVEIWTRQVDSHLALSAFGAVAPRHKQCEHGCPKRTSGFLEARNTWCRRADQGEVFCTSMRAIWVLDEL
jgi:hypothetical protein